MFTGLTHDASPLLRDKAEIREARELFVTLNACAPWAVAEAKKRRFTKAVLGHMRQEKRELDAAERRAEMRADALPE